MDDLKKGKSKVIEKGHYLVLGWTDKSIQLLYELALSFESSGGGVIVVLAEHEKVEMEFEVSEDHRRRPFKTVHSVVLLRVPLARLYLAVHRAPSHHVSLVSPILSHPLSSFPPFPSLPSLSRLF